MLKWGPLDQVLVSYISQTNMNKDHQKSLHLILDRLVLIQWDINHLISLGLSFFD